MVQRQNLVNKVIEDLGVCGYGFFSLQYYFQFYSYNPEAGETVDADLLVTSIMYNLYSVWNLFLKNKEINEHSNMRNKHWRRCFMLLSIFLSWFFSISSLLFICLQNYLCTSPSARLHLGKKMGIHLKNIWCNTLEAFFFLTHVS